MTEIPVTARIPERLEKELKQYMKIEHLEKSAAVRKLLFESLQEWRVKFALRLLEEGRTTISKGAELAGLDIWSFMAKIREHKIQWVSDEVIDDDLKEFR
ncbi:MAG TPA: UPF0175 family protein [Candidatus Nanoarchaeia archaeon]|nr:UPF0175 family protein [Candidatus Nanoarchaeia archaeon]